MSNLESQAQAQVSAARTGFRAWAAANPFRYGLYAMAAGAVVLAAFLLTVHFAL